MKRCILYTDGGTRGTNPGISACGFIMQEPDGKAIVEGALLLDGKTSNNVAEWAGLIFGLYNAAERGYTHVHAYTDSQLMANQMKGTYAIKSELLLEAYEQAMEEVDRLDKFTIDWIRRDKNVRADRLVRNLLDAEMERRKAAGK